jgi:hypothetical protein
MNARADIEFERWPTDQPLDETDVSVRAYVTRLPAEHLKKYDPAWTDEQVIEWDGNFRSDGALMLVCCERDVDVQDFRRVVEGFLEYCAGGLGFPTETRSDQGTAHRE